MTFYGLCLFCGNGKDEIPAMVGYCSLGAEVGFPLREGAMSSLHETDARCLDLAVAGPSGKSVHGYRITCDDRRKVYWCISD